MSIGEKILLLLEGSGMKQKELASSVNISQSALSDLLNGKTKKLDIQKAKDISKILGCSLDYLLDDACNKNSIGSFLSPKELEHIKKYRQIKPHEKEMVDTVLNIAYKEYERLEKIKADRIMEQQASYLCSPAERNYPDGIYQIDDFKNEEEGRISIPVYDFGVSAGTGVFLDNPCYEVVSMPEDALSRKANFALWVTGDSMEPRFHDGDLVLVKIQPSVEIGEIGIFVLNGEGYIKKWGGNKLVSLNPVYEPIMLTEDDALYCKGKVIGNA